MTENVHARLGLSPQLVTADLLSIRIPNWLKFNPRPDRVNFTWFRMENTFFHDQRVFLLNTEQKLIYLFLLCEVSKKNNDSVKISPKYLAAILQYSEETVRKDIQYLAHLNLVELIEIHLPMNRSETPKEPSAQTCMHDDGTLPASVRPTLRDVTIQEEKKNTLGCLDDNPMHAAYAPHARFDFESIYQLYPKRLGSNRKADAMKILHRKIKSLQDFEALKKATKNYSLYCHVNNKEGTEFVSQFKTFVGEVWKEWIEPDKSKVYGQTSTEQHSLALERTKARIREQYQPQDEAQYAIE